MRDRAKTLARIHRVRTLQVQLARTEEARTSERLASETSLRDRIGQLAQSVAPEMRVDAGFGFAAAAHFRDRLHRTAEAADARLRVAEGAHARAGVATREAKRDQSAVEKLIDRNRATGITKALRAMEDMPPGKGKRHDPC